MIGATLESWHSRAMRVVIEGVGDRQEVWVLIYIILLHAARRAMAAAPLLPEQHSYYFTNLPLSYPRPEHPS